MKAYEAPELFLIPACAADLLSVSGEISEEITATDYFTEAYGYEF